MQKNTSFNFFKRQVVEQNEIFQDLDDVKTYATCTLPVPSFLHMSEHGRGWVWGRFVFRLPPAAAAKHYAPARNKGPLWLGALKNAAHNLQQVQPHSLAGRRVAPATGPNNSAGRHASTHMGGQGHTLWG